MIFVMGITMLKLDRAKATWRVKLQRAFSDQRLRLPLLFFVSVLMLRNYFPSSDVDRGTRTGKWVLFILPMITVLREGEYRA
jgi:high-affinity iron transporter